MATKQAKTTQTDLDPFAHSPQCHFRRIALQIRHEHLASGLCTCPEIVAADLWCKHVPVECDGDILVEACCICRKRTNFWYVPNDVALCQDCSKVVMPDEIPSKKEWMAKEDAIAQGRKYAQPVGLKASIIKHGQAGWHTLQINMSAEQLESLLVACEQRGSQTLWEIKVAIEQEMHEKGMRRPH